MSRRPHVGRELLFGCTLAACFGVLLPMATAQTRVRVMAETRIDVAAERAGSSVQVLGVLRDDLGQALPHRELHVFTRQLMDDTATPLADTGVFGAETILTDERGEFTLTVAWVGGRFALSCSFVGDEFHLPASVERVVDPTLADVRLRFDLHVTARELDLDLPDAQVRVVAESSQGGEGLALTLRDELGRVHGSATTDAGGHATFQLGDTTEATPGPGRWVVDFPGDTQRAAARAELPIVRLRATVLTATLPTQALDPGESVTLSGTLRDSRGGVAGGAVGVFGDGEHVTTVVTDASGAYRATFDVPRHREGTTWTLEARFAPEAPGPQPSVSPSIALRVTSPWPLDWLWLLLPLGLSVLALLVARRRERRTSQPALRTTALPPGITVGARTHGTHRHDQLAGVILDHQSGAPRAGAIITLSHAASASSGAPELRAESDHEGRFTLSGLPAGEYRLRVQLAGYVGVDQGVSVPHRGEWSDVVVRVESYRARALAVFRRVGRRFVTSERVFETTTNREIPDAAPETHRGQLLALAQQTDRLYYGPVDPEAVDLPPLEHAAAALEQQIQPARLPRDPSD